MGSSISRRRRSSKEEDGPGGEPKCADLPGSDLRLPTCGLVFSPPQLRLINRRLNEFRLEHRKAAELSSSAERRLQRLAQRLVRGAAAADPRFSCSYLLVMHRRSAHAMGPLEYVAIIDALSSGVTPGGEEEVMAEWGAGGAGELRVCVPQRGAFDEFLTPAGFLRRDKLLERWVELLATAGAGPLMTSRGPPFALDALTLRLIAAAKGNHHCFSSDGAGCEEDDLEERVERVALSSAGAAGVWVRVRAGAGELRLALGALRTGPVPTADWPTRICLSHSHAPYLACADTGWLAMCGVGGSGGAGAGWPIWAVGAERAASLSHTSRRLDDALLAALHHLKDGQRSQCGRIRAVSRYLVMTSSRWHLEQMGERAAGRGAKGASLRLSTAAHLSRHFLLVIDRLVECIRRRSLRHWVLPSVDVLRLSRRADQDWRADGDCLAAFLALLHSATHDDLDRRVTMPALSRRECLELAMASRWTAVTQELCLAGGGGENLLSSSSHSCPSANISYSSAFSQRQIQYIAFISRETLTVRKLRMQEHQSSFKRNLLMVTAQRTDPFEDLLDLLTIVLVQARERYLISKCKTSLMVETAAALTNITKESRPKKSSKAHKISSGYDRSACRIAENLKNDLEMRSKNLSNDATLVRVLLDYLYRSIFEDKKRLYPVLKPYLDELYLTSSENCWFIDEYKWTDVKKEFNSLCEFSRLVCEHDLDPAEGLLDAARKEWIWAQYVLELAECVELTFVRADGSRVDFEVSVPRGWSLQGCAEARGREGGARAQRARKQKAARWSVTAAFAAALLGNASDIAISGRYWNNSSTLDLSTPSQTARPRDALDCPTLRSVASVSCATLDFPTPHHPNKLVPDVGVRCSPLDAVIETSLFPATHSDPRALLDQLLTMHKYTVVQELCTFLGGRVRHKSALRALQTLRRAAKGGPIPNALNGTARGPRGRSGGGLVAESPQSYTPRTLDYVSADERLKRRAPQRKPPKERKKEMALLDSGDSQTLLMTKIALKIPEDYDSSRSAFNSSLPNSSSRMDCYTGVIHYAANDPREKRAKSLSRAFSGASRRPPLPSPSRRTLYDVTPPVTSPPSRAPSFASQHNYQAK